jgi:hypothetical protein
MLIWRYRLFCVVLIAGITCARAQESTATEPPVQSIFNNTDSSAAEEDTDTLVYHDHFVRMPGLLDTFTNDTVLTSIFKPYVNIRSPFFERSFSRERRLVPTVKEIHERPQRRQEWRFWVISFILVYIAFVRISHENGFKAFIISVFNLRMSEKIWEDQRSYLGFIYLQLFAIYIFIAALFISYLMELRSITFFNNPFYQFMAIVGGLIVVYFLKFILHGFLGGLLKMKTLGVGFVTNTVAVNNFIALVIFPFIIFLLYNNYELLRIILVQTIIATFFISIMYRVVRIALLSNSFFSFPIIYLFIYLCALEILPWFVIVKFLNQFQI